MRCASPSGTRTSTSAARAPRRRASTRPGCTAPSRRASRSWLGSEVEDPHRDHGAPEHGLPQEVVDATDVLLWWGHEDHPGVADEVVDRVHRAVLGAWASSCCHSGHYSKIFKKLMGTECSLRWRNDGDRELVWTVAPRHPIAAGVPDPIVIPSQEMYGEFFDIPTPDESSSFVVLGRRGVSVRSVLARGLAGCFYSRPGDQEYPVYLHTRRATSHRERRAVGGARHASGADRRLPRAARVVRGDSGARRTRTTAGPPPARPSRVSG